jgi:hypothetical protein
MAAGTLSDLALGVIKNIDPVERGWPALRNARLAEGTFKCISHFSRHVRKHRDMGWGLRLRVVLARRISKSVLSNRNFQRGHLTPAKEAASKWMATHEKKIEYNDC